MVARASGRIAPPAPCNASAPASESARAGRGPAAAPEHGEGVHHTAFACGDLPWAERVWASEERGFACVQPGVWLGRVPCAYFATGEATSTIFELYDIPPDFVLPEPEEWYPGPPPA